MVEAVSLGSRRSGDRIRCRLGWNRVRVGLLAFRGGCFFQRVAFKEELRDIGAWRQRDADAQFGLVLGVIEQESLPDFAGAVAHNGVGVCIVSRPPVEDTDADGAFFQVCRIARQRVFHNVAEQGGIALAVAEIGTFDNVPEFTEDGIAPLGRLRGNGVAGGRDFTHRTDKSYSSPDRCYKGVCNKQGYVRYVGEAIIDACKTPRDKRLVTCKPLICEKKISPAFAKKDHCTA